MSRDFVGALLQLNAEKGVPREQLILTIADAIESAYRRIPGNEDVRVRIDPERGEMLVTRERRVVADVEDPLTELTVDDARAIKPDAEVGEDVVTEQLGQDAFGRIGAQTAKQVVLQRLREAERDVVYDQFASREGDLITGTVNRVEPRAIILDLGKAEAILATTEQSPVEHYRIGQNVKAFVLEVRRAPRGPPGAGEPHPQGLPAPPVRAGGPRDPRGHRGDQGDRPRARQPLARWPSRPARRASTPSGQRSASAAHASRRWSPSWPARRST